MDTWIKAEARAKKKGTLAGTILLLKNMFLKFQFNLNYLSDVVILDINKSGRKSGPHSVDVAVDFCFADDWYIKNSVVIKAGVLAGFNGIGIYYGSKMSYHLDFQDRVAFWKAKRGPNGTWVYDYSNMPIPEWNEA